MKESKEFEFTLKIDYCDAGRLIDALNFYASECSLTGPAVLASKLEKELRKQVEDWT